MAKNMIEMNNAAFNLIHDFVLNYDADNFKVRKKKVCIETNEDEKQVIKNININDTFSLYNKFSLIELELGGRRFIAVKGFNDLTLNKNDLEKYQYTGFCAGIYTVLLSEGFIQPVSETNSIFSLYDRFLYDDGLDEVRVISYLELEEHFEKFSFFEIVSDSLNSERVFGCLILENNKSYLHNKIEVDLIKRTFENGSDILPFQNIIKSLLYHDEPKHLFLEIYRCIERMYSFPAMEKLREKLKIKQKDNIKDDVSAFELSEIVENALGWRQSEENGLKMLISSINDNELTTALEYLDRTSIRLGISELYKDINDVKNITDCERRKAKEEENRKKKADLIAKRIYKCRNSFVHFRETFATPYVEENDIPQLCNLLLFLLDPIYSQYKWTNNSKK